MDGITAMGNHQQAAQHLLTALKVRVLCCAQRTRPPERRASTLLYLLSSLASVRRLSMARPARGGAWTPAQVSAILQHNEMSGSERPRLVLANAPTTIARLEHITLLTVIACQRPPAEHGEAGPRRRMDASAGERDPPA